MAEKGADWGMADKKIQQDYVVTMTARLMNMQSHLTHEKIPSSRSFGMLS